MIYLKLDSRVQMISPIERHYTIFEHKSNPKKIKKSAENIARPSYSFLISESKIGSMFSMS